MRGNRAAAARRRNPVLKFLRVRELFSKSSRVSPYSNRPLVENPRPPGLFFLFFCSLISAVAVVGAVESVEKAEKPSCRLFFPRVEKGDGAPRRRWRDGGKPPGFPRGAGRVPFPQRIHRESTGVVGENPPPPDPPDSALRRPLRKVRGKRFAPPLPHRPARFTVSLPPAFR